MKIRVFFLIGLMVSLMIGCGSNNDNQNKVVLINLGDSYANGVQSGSGNINQYTQVNSYPQIIANQMYQSVELIWGNPLVDKNKHRIDGSFVPYNLGVDGATVQSLLMEKSDDWAYMNELFKPIPSFVGRPVTQLEAAEFVASQNLDSTPKIITLLIGGNDILGTVNAGGGTQLTASYINAFFNDKDIYGNPLHLGHDLDSVSANLTTIIDRLKAIPNSHIFIGNLPSVAGIAGLFNNHDIERLATYPNPHVTALADGEYMGLVPVLGLGYSPGINLNIGTSTNPVYPLNSNDATLNGVILQTLGTPIPNMGGVTYHDFFTLTAAEASIIQTRTNAINSVINSLVAANSNVHLVDLVSFFNDVIAGNVSVNGHVISRSYGGGLFSVDGFHPSNTGYALIANVFIDAINNAGIIPAIPKADLVTIWNNDPYQDKDGDGYVPGPTDRTIINSMFIPFLDCNDSDNTKFAPFPTAGINGTCP